MTGKRWCAWASSKTSKPLCTTHNIVLHIQISYVHTKGDLFPVSLQNDALLVYILLVYAAFLYKNFYFWSAVDVYGV